MKVSVPAHRYFSFEADILYQSCLHKLMTDQHGRIYHPAFNSRSTGRLRTELGKRYETKQQEALVNSIYSHMLPRMNPLPALAADTFADGITICSIKDQT